MRDVIKIYIPIFVIISFVSIIAWKFYPILRFDYEQFGETRNIIRIDRVNGEIYRLQISDMGNEQGWHRIKNNEYPK